MTDVETPPAPSRRRSILLAAVVVVLAFGAGVIAGVVGDRVYLATHERILPRGGIEFVGKHLLHRLDRRLDLTDEQEAQVQAIIERRTQRMLGSWNEVHKTFHDELNAAHTEIAEVLTPEQRAKFEEMQRRWHGHRSKRRAW